VVTDSDRAFVHGLEPLRAFAALWTLALYADNHTTTESTRNETTPAA